MEEKTYNGPINIDSLIKTLSKNLRNPLFKFYWKDFALIITDLYTSNRTPFQVTRINSQIKSKPFSYKTSSEYKTIYLESELGLLNEYINPNWTYLIDINSEEKTTNFSVIIKYKDSEKIAIKLETQNATEFIIICEQIDLTGFFNMPNTILNVFDKKLLDSNSPETKNWLYQQIPVESIHFRYQYYLWNDLVELLVYDKDSKFSDSSTSLMKVLTGISKTHDGLNFLYGQFESNPIRVKEIYHFLDKNGSSEEYEGRQVPNKTIFASFIRGICLYQSQGFSLKERVKNDIGFIIDKTHKVDSNIALKYDKEEDKYDLKQLELKTETRYSQKEGYYYNDESYIITSSHSLHPLDLVSLYVENDQGKLSSYVVPAIFIKDIAHMQEWEDINFAIRVGVDLFVVILGIATLGTSTPALIAALLVIDATIAGVDLFVQLLKDPISKTKWGKQFLETWEKIYFIGGLTTAIFSAPHLVKSLLQGAARLFSQATLTATKQFLARVMFKIILEINIANYSGKTIKAVEAGVEIFKKAKIEINTPALYRMEKQGDVAFIGLIDEADNMFEFIAMYKGEVIASGTAKELRETLKPAMSLTGKKLLHELDRILGKMHLDALYMQGYQYVKVLMPERHIINALYPGKGLKLVDTVDNYVQSFKSGINPFIGAAETANTIKGKVLVAGAYCEKYIDDIVMHTNFPKSKLDSFIKLNNIFREGSSLNDIKKIYKHMLLEGHIKYDLHPLIENRLLRHFEELQKGIKHSSNYIWEHTGGFPGIHAEVLSINELLWKIEAKGVNLTDEIFKELVVYNKRIFDGNVMIRCGDCNFLTYDVQFIEIQTNILKL